MANYAYIKCRIDRVTAYEMLRSIVDVLWGDKMVVRDGEEEDFYGPTWVVYAPGTALPHPECNRAMVAPDEDFGFTVSLQKGGMLAFRRPVNSWESWAQGCVIEAMSEILGTPHEYDATDESKPPGTKDYLCEPTFREWVWRNLNPQDPADQDWVARRFEAAAPKGFW